MPRFKWKTALCLLTYQAPNTDESEVLWNSRDGRAPDSISSRENAVPLTHVQSLDVFRPKHVPRVGDRIVVDLTELRARVIAAACVELAEAADAGMPGIQELYETREAAVQATFENVYRPGAPDILVVTSRYIEELERHRSSAAEVGHRFEGQWFDRQGRPISALRGRELRANDHYISVAYTRIDRDVEVSTVWRGLDDGTPGAKAPLIFDSRCYVGGEARAYRGRYATEGEALAGHAETVAKLTAALKLFGRVTKLGRRG